MSFNEERVQSILRGDPIPPAALATFSDIEEAARRRFAAGPLKVLDESTLIADKSGTVTGTLRIRETVLLRINTAGDE